ncbi:methylesterase 10-like [Prunus avium]|uniref:Methylesterase 10-like n=1 Tax=Prunus avium TaxID=42229 RepID=A0A6P5T3U4_PRUAV|nr:methylesterase 10-like [Prunus avium]
MDQRKKVLIKSISTLLIILLCAANITESEPTNPSKKQFVLVHGSCFGAWSWYKLVTLMKSSGHNVTALDLAASGVDPQQAKDLHSISDYFKPLTDFMAALDPPHDKVILVGHSLGGLAISYAMERFPDKISLAVFVTALMPGPTLNISSLNQGSFGRQGSLLDSKYTYEQGYVWSNERYESVEHRVMVNSEKERFSIPFFLSPAHYTQVKPLEELTDERNPAKYKPYRWGKFITHRKLSNFKKLSTENIQIYHFRVLE